MMNQNQITNRNLQLSTMTKGLFLTFALTVGLALPDAQAFKIRVTDLTAGTPAEVVADNGVGDSNGTTGLINTTFTTTNFSIVTTIGTSKPLGGNSASFNRIDLLNVNVTSSTGGGMLLVEITDTDFTNAMMAAVGGTFTTSIGGTLGYSSANTLMVESFWDATNTDFGTGSALSNLGTYSGPNSFSGDDVVTTAALGAFSSPFSLTQRVTITMTSDDVISYDSDLYAQPVPEPSTLLLLGSGLAGLIGYRRKFFQA